MAAQKQARDFLKLQGHAIRHGQSSSFEVLLGSADEAGASKALASYSNLKTQQMTWLESFDPTSHSSAKQLLQVEELHRVLAKTSDSSSQAHCYLS